MKLLKKLRMLWAFITSGEVKRASNGKRVLTVEDLQTIDRLRREKFKKVLKTKGILEFTIEGITVFARDEENAKRKVNNLKKRLSCHGTK